VNDQVSVLRRGAALLVRCIRTHPRPFATAMAGAIVFAAASVLGTVLLGRLTDEVLAPSFAGAVPSARVWAFAAAVFVAALLRAVGTIMRRFSAAVTSRRMQVTLRTQITDVYLRTALAWLRARPTGELLAHADTDVEVAVESVNPLPFSLGLVALIVFAVISLFAADPILALVGLALFPSLFVLNRHYTRRVEAPAAAVQARVGDVSTIAHESFDGVMVVKTLGLERHEIDRLAAASSRLRDERLRVGALRAMFEPMLDALPALGVVAVLALGAWRVSDGAMTAGDMVQVIALFNLLTFPMRVVGFLLEELPRSVVAMDRIDSVLAAPEVAAPPAPVMLPDGPLAVECTALSFAYLPDEPILAACSLRIRPGEVLAIVGSTGSGKTTLCELIAGLMPADSGTIRVGGVPIESIDPSVFHREVALVFQESFLFADTVRENLALGDADPDDVRQAMRITQADRFVARLTAGDDTVLGERGVTLSGGQRQRLALARALARTPRVLILDDATSAVDPSVEARILDGLRGAAAVTTIIVAHRVSTIALADRVAVLRAGRVAALGTHNRLLAADADYRALVSAYESTNDERDDPDPEPEGGADGLGVAADGLGAP
jgi:ABC-type multidrug transport system fused ATPase/permease subunit